LHVVLARVCFLIDGGLVAFWRVRCDIDCVGLRLGTEDPSGDGCLGVQVARDFAAQALALACSALLALALACLRWPVEPQVRCHRAAIINRWQRRREAGTVGRCPAAGKLRSCRGAR
jgi:hypothetical protein